MDDSGANASTNGNISSSNIRVLFHIELNLVFIMIVVVLV